MAMLSVGHDDAKHLLTILRVARKGAGTKIGGAAIVAASKSCTGHIYQS